MAVPHRQRILSRVNYKVRVPGFAEPFTPLDMRFDVEARILYIKAREVTPFYEHDDLRIAVLDLDIPAPIRRSLTNDGWVELGMDEFVSILRLAYSMES